MKKTVLILSLVGALAGCSNVHVKSATSATSAEPTFIQHGKRYIVKVDSVYQKAETFYANVELKTGEKVSVVVSERDYNKLLKELSYNKNTIVKMYKVKESGDLVKVEVIH